MNRRALIRWLAAAMLAPPFVWSQPTGKVWRVGMLRIRLVPTFDEAFRAGLRDLGYVPGKNLALEYRFAEQKLERFPELAADLLRLKVDVIVAGGNDAILAAKEATRVTPIVMALSTDPVRAGFVASLARPGANVTGVSVQPEGLAGKWVELLKETLPSVTRVAVLGNPANPGTSGQMRDMGTAARKLGVTLQFVTATGAQDFDGAFAAMVRERANAFLVQADALFFAERGAIVGLAAKHRLPAVYENREYVESGGMMSYGPNFPDLFRRVAAQVDKILKGAKPADIPVELPTKFDLVVNLKVARTLGVKIPQTVLLRADQVIE